MPIPSILVRHADGVTEALYQFFAAWSCQDWNLDAPTWEAVVDDFTSTESKVESVVSDLRDARRMLATETAAVEFLSSVGCYDRPSGRGETCLGWPTAVESRLAEVTR